MRNGADQTVNHRLGDLLVLAEPHYTLERLGIKKEGVYPVAAKAGIAIRLKLPSGDLTGWICDSEALAALQQFFGNTGNGHHPPPAPDRSAFREEMWRWILRNQPGGDL